MQKNSTNKRVGNAGESAACLLLKSKGHKIIARNVRLKRGEIDILTSKDNIIHLIEVKSIKTALSEDYMALNKLIYNPEDNFSPAKLRKLRSLGSELRAFYPYNKGLLRYFYKSNPHLITKDTSSSQTEGKYNLESLLKDGGEPVIQIDGVAVRLLIKSNQIKAAKARYFPFLA